MMVKPKMIFGLNSLHHVEPRVILFVPTEESIPIPLKYIDDTRTTGTTLDVMLEKSVDDCWNVDGDRESSRGLVSLC